MMFMVMAIQGNLTSPVCRRGSRRARMGPPVTRHLQHSVCVCHNEHGRLLEGWEGGKGDPNETPRPSGRVGWGIVVGAWESHVHQDVH